MADPKTTAETRAARAATKVWTDEERAAMKDKRPRAEGLLRGATRPRSEPRARPTCRRRSPSMPAADRAMGERIHALVLDAAPDLVPKTYYGMPAYAKDGKVICFYKPASKFKVRYSMFEFQPDASPRRRRHVGGGPSRSSKLTPAVEKQIAGLVKQAAR